LVQVLELGLVQRRLALVRPLSALRFLGLQFCHMQPNQRQQQRRGESTCSFLHSLKKF
jgi:hypothetical protein